MDRHEAVTACVAQMQLFPQFSSASDDQKAKAAAFAFDRLHDDAMEFLPFGSSGDEVRRYCKAATRRVHKRVEAMDAEEFEQANGFPIMLALSLIPLLWQWWKMLKEWLGWQ